MKINIVFLLLVVCLVSVSNKPVPKRNFTIKKVVIDPGHGGNDSGCLGSSCQEKNIALAISLKFGKLIEENFKDIKVIYTRTTDKFVELKERAEIANRESADLFICIHCNSGQHDAYGIETYAMGLHKTEDNLNVAKRENASILLEDDYKKNYNGFNPSSPEAYIAFSLYQNAFLDQSLSLSSKIQHEVKSTGRYDRGVKQAGFLVLWRTTMPSILVETGFLTNHTEEQYMKTEDGQNAIATAIFKGFKSYKIEVESGKGVLKNQKEDKEPIVNPKKEPTNPPKEIQNPPKKETVFPPKKEQGTPPKEIVSIPKKEAQPVKDSIVAKETPKIETSAPVRDTLLYTKPTTTVQKVAPPDTLVQNIEPKVTAVQVLENETYFAVQITILPTPTPITSAKFNGATDVRMENWGNNTYKYVVGHETSIDKATYLQTSLRNKGFKDAFVVAYSNGKRIPVKEALLIQNKKK